MIVRVLTVLALAAAAAFANDEVLRAMRDEMARAKTLKLAGVDPLYYIEYGLDDVETFSATASLGALVNSGENRLRVPRVQVRVGTPEFDNTNYLFSDFFGRVSGGGFPLENDYASIRRFFWLASDRVFKGSVQAISRKRAALKNVTQQEKLNDFAPAPLAKLDLGATKPARDDDRWVARIKSLSAIFAQFPKITSSRVLFSTGFGTSYVVNSEGTEIRYPDDLAFVRVFASGQSADGMPIHDAVSFEGARVDQLPGEPEMRAAATELGRTLTALLDAPAGEDYNGPVLVEGVASPQIVAQTLGANLAMIRRPVTEPGRQFPIPTSELEGRIGSRILPEFLDVVDDPVSTEWNGRRLFGHFPIDMEGVIPKPLTVVTKGALQSFLLTRQPVRGFEGSNGRARLPGPFGSKLAAHSNLIVKSSQSSPLADLRKKLLEMVSQRGKPYGLIIRKLDFPAAVPAQELQRIMAVGRGTSNRPVCLPVLVYRVYPDGREELVRGMRFRNLNARSLRDIAAVSNESSVFSYLGDGSPLPAYGGASYVAPHSVVSPSLLFEDLELDKREEDWPKLPAVPAPELTSAVR